MMASDASKQQDESTFEERIETLLSDPAKKSLILQKLGLDDLANKDPANKEGTEDRINRPTMEALANLTPSGKSAGASWPQVPAPFWMAPFFPANPTAPGSGCGYGPMFVPPGFYPPGPGIHPDNRAGPESEEPGPSVSGTSSAEKSHDVEDTIDLLDESEALEMGKFDPSVSPKDSWEPPRSMVSFTDPFQIQRERRL